MKEILEKNLYKSSPINMEVKKLQHFTSKSFCLSIIITKIIVSLKKFHLILLETHFTIVGTMAIICYNLL